MHPSWHCLASNASIVATDEGVASFHPTSLAHDEGVSGAEEPSFSPLKTAGFARSITCTPLCNDQNLPRRFQPTRLRHNDVQTGRPEHPGSDPERLDLSRQGPFLSLPCCRATITRVPSHPWQLIPETVNAAGVINDGVSPQPL